MENLSDKYPYLFRNTALSKWGLVNALNIKPFEDEIKLLAASGAHFDDQVVYKAVEKLLFPMQANHDQTQESKKLYKLIREFSKNLYGDPEAWRKDYEVYIAANNLDGR